MRRGFTILELLVLLSVLAFVGASVVRTYFLRPNITLENAAILLADDLRSTQNRSAYLGEVSHFRFYGDGDGYSVTDAEGFPVINPRTESLFERRYSIDGVFDGVHILEVDAGNSRTLTFDERGQARKPLSVTLAFGSARRKITVTRGSGRVAIDGSSSGWVDDGF